MEQIDTHATRYSECGHMGSYIIRVSGWNYDGVNNGRRTCYWDLFLKTTMKRAKMTITLKENLYWRILYHMVGV